MSSSSPLDVVIILVLLLMACGVGAAGGMLWLLRSRALAERQRLDDLDFARRLASTAVDIAATRGITLAEAQQAIAKTMQAGPALRRKP